MNATFSNSPGAPAQMRRGRPRSEQSRAAVLRATSELLHEVGAQAMTTEEIAARSGVSKATIYKWWPNKYAVAVEAFLSEMMAQSPDPNTGSAQEDFRSVLRGMAQRYHLNLDDFTDIVGRLFKQPKEGLGFDNTPSSHMWRTLMWPTRFL